MRKLIIQIPCFNEEKTIGVTLEALPREVPGFDCVERLVIDDGSSDRTVEIAREHGVEHIVRLPHNQGLAKAFQAGLDAAVKRGAGSLRPCVPYSDASSDASRCVALRCGRLRVARRPCWSKHRRYATIGFRP